MHSWSAIQAYADYTQETIDQLRVYAHNLNGDDIKGKAGHLYTPKERKYNEVQLSFDNNECWLSQGIETMYGEKYIMPTQDSRVAFFIVELTVEGNSDASIDLNIGALKIYDNNITESRYVNGNVRDGKYIDETQIKGVAYSNPENECTLYYEINDETSYLPISVSNYNNGYKAHSLYDKSFITHGAPKGDGYEDTKYNYVENDMFNYNYDNKNYNIFNGWYVNNNKSYNLGNLCMK